MQIELRPLASIKPYEQNPRINDDAVEAVAASIREFGFRQPLVLDEQGVIIVGHTRWKAAQRLGLEQVPVHVAIDLTPAQVKALRIADNQTASIADWDYDLLPIELADLRGMDFDLNLLGFDADELTKILNPELEEGECDPDEVPAPPDEAITQPGDLWILGNHRLLCGDSSKPADLDRLLDGNSIHLLNMDPPYNVKVEPRRRTPTARSTSSTTPPGRFSSWWASSEILMSADPRKLKPGALCQLLNSTPLGEVINQSHLRQHRTSVGLRIGDGKTVDLVRYAAWLMEMRHAPKPPQQPKHSAPILLEIEEATEGAATAASTGCELRGHGQKLSKKQELLIAGLLLEPTYAAAAAKAGVSQATLYRWLQLPGFREAYRQARWHLLNSALGRMQAAAGQAVSTLINITVQGRKDGDRVRAAIAILVHSERMLAGDDLPIDGGIPKAGSPIDTAEVVQVLADRLRQLSVAEISTIEKSRMTATLSDTLLRAIEIDVLDKRLEALQSVFKDRKDKAKK